MKKSKLARETFNYSNLVQDLREVAFSYLNYAQANISGHRVAAAILATRKYKPKSRVGLRYRDRTSDTFRIFGFRIFGGCNLEISVSTVIHAVCELDKQDLKLPITPIYKRNNYGSYLTVIGLKHES